MRSAHPAGLARLAFVVALLAVLLAAGCGGGEKVYTLPDGEKMTVSQMIDKIEEVDPTATKAVCVTIEQTGEAAARHSFNSGYGKSFPKGTVASDEVFDELASRC